MQLWFRTAELPGFDMRMLKFSLVHLHVHSYCSKQSLGGWQYCRASMAHHTWWEMKCWAQKAAAASDFLCWIFRQEVFAGGKGATDAWLRLGFTGGTWWEMKCCAQKAAAASEFPLLDRRRKVVRWREG